jgi:L-alanine-DL-glutamate epimerase-like enolase superfamily enzyme
LKITEVEAIPLLVPEDLPVPGDPRYGLFDALLVRVHTDEGIVGLGEGGSEPTVVKAIIDAPRVRGFVRGLRSVVLDQDPFDVQMLWHRMVAGIAWCGRGGASMHAIAALDMALWDIVAQATGRPLHQVLGGAFRDHVRAYATDIMPQTPPEVHDLVARHMAHGFTAVKVGWGPLGLVSPALDVELVAAAREAAGERDLMIDLGARWDASYAIQMARRFAPFRLFWMEEPLPPDDLDGYARLATAVDLRIAAGERETTYQGLVTAAERGGLAVLQPDLSLAGGLTPCLRVAQYAYDRNILCVPHVYSTDVLLAASLHFVAAMPHGQLVEFRISESPLVRELVAEPLQLETDGTLRVPRAPGLGVTLNEEVVRRFAQGPVLPLPGRQV